MNKENFFKILDKYHAGTCTPEEMNVILQFCDNVQITELTKNWSLSKEEEIKTRLLKKVTDAIDNQTKTVVDKNQPSGHQFVFLRVAASILMVLGLSWLYFSTQIEEPNIEYLSKSTKRGQKATITLSDGSVVKLNSESEIVYSKDFIESSYRKINLTGEAYFEVVKDESRPFIVTSGNIKTTVLGTSFNINAYRNESIQVSLYTGNVHVARVEKDEAVNLLPGEQALANAAGISVIKFNSESALAWKDGTIIFENTEFNEVISILENWYDVSFIIKNLSDEKRNSLKVTGKFKDQSLVSVLKLLSHSMNFRFSMNKKVVTLKFLEEDKMN